MAGWLSRLFGADTGTQAAVSLDPAPGEGGYALGSGPTGQDGYPGSGITNKLVRGTPRNAKIPADRDSGLEQDTYGAEVVDASHRGDVPGASVRSPRAPQRATVSRRRVTAFQDEDRATNLGGPPMRPQPGAETVGLNPLSGAQAAGGHSEMSGQTPYRQAWPEISGNVPGSQNVQALWAERYKAVPGTERAGMSSTRSDQAPPQAAGWQASGSVKPWEVTEEVTTTDRLVTPEISWSFDREWPYQRADRTNNGERLYFPALNQFLDGNMGAVGSRNYQSRPTTFDVPAPWTGNFMDSSTPPGQAPSAGQQPDAVYVPPPSPRASSGTGRR
jgi:hypothetical protein